MVIFFVFLYVLIYIYIYVIIIILSLYGKIGTLYTVVREKYPGFLSSSTYLFIETCRTYDCPAN